MEKIKPLWEIKKPKFMSPWDTEIERRFVVIVSIPIDLFLKQLDVNYLQRKITSQGLENPELDNKKIKGILERWAAKLPVDPPVLIWSNEGWLISDGIHRINCAISLGATTIPVVFNRFEYPLWKNLPV